jgi:Holliday junction DNA helicase RuvB
VENTLRLIRGLPRERLLKEIFFHHRNGEASRRALAFYLLDLSERREYRALGYRSAAHFAAENLDLERDEAREHLRVAAALEELPLLDGAFSRGELGWSKVRELARVATAETESEWLEIARKKNARQVAWAVRGKRKGSRPGKKELDTRPPTVRIQLDVPVETSHLWNVALAKELAALGAGATPAQALKAIAELVLRKEPDGSVPGMKDRKEPVYTVIRHLSPDGRSAHVESEEGPMPIPLSAIAEVVNEARVVEVEDLAPGEGHEIRLGERGAVPAAERDPPATEAMKTAVFLRHGGCCAICGEGGRIAGTPAELRTHHFDAAADGGKTAVARLVPVCRICHGNLHAGVTHLRMDAREGLIALDRHGNPLRREGGAAAALREAEEVYPLAVLERARAGETVAASGESSPAGDDGPMEDGSREPGLAAAARPFAISAIESLADLPAEVTAAEWRALAGRLEWSPGRRSFLLRNEWDGMWFAQSGSRVPLSRNAADSRESFSRNQGGSREPLSPFRPGALDGFIGQGRTVANLKLAIAAARARGEPLGHLLLSGPPGLGKTTLARLAALELGAGFHPAVGLHLEEPHELISLLSGLGRGDVLFIDELHGLRKSCQECLYGALEDGVLDVTVSEGVSTRALRIRLEPFTLIGATSEPGTLAEPFRARFALAEGLEFYAEEDLARVVAGRAPELRTAIEPRAAAAIARRARGTPREALRLLHRARDVVQTRQPAGPEAPAIEVRHVEWAARGLGIEADGLNPGDLRLLELLARAGRPMGLETIASALRVDARTVKTVHEPYLRERGYLTSGPRGREATCAGRARVRAPAVVIAGGRSIPIAGRLRAG